MLSDLNKTDDFTFKNKLEKASIYQFKKLKWIKERYFTLIVSYFQIVNSLELF
jgi:hypothetical protein